MGVAFEINNFTISWGLTGLLVQIRLKSLNEFVKRKLCFTMN